MNADDVLRTLEDQLRSAVQFFWTMRSSQSERQGGQTGDRDLWTAYREGAFKTSPRPWLGYCMMLEDAPVSPRPVAVREMHFKPFKEFKNTSYADRYAILCKRLVLERFYDAACFIMSSRETGPSGDFREPDPQLTFRAFATSLVAHATTFAKLRK